MSEAWSQSIFAKKKPRGGARLLLARKIPGESPAGRPGLRPRVAVGYAPC